MNRYNIFLTLILAAVVATGFAFIQKSKDLCNPVDLKKKTEPTMKPYTYDSAKMSRLQFMKKPQKFSTEVPLSLFGQYKIVFNTSGMPKKVGINVYDKDKGSDKRKLLFSNADSLETDPILVFNPAKHTRKVFVDYDVPADTLNLKIKGCLYFMLGYK